MDEKDNDQSSEISETSRPNIDTKVMVGIGLVILILLGAILLIFSKADNQPLLEQELTEVTSEEVADKLVLPETWPKSVPVADDATKTYKILDTFAPASTTVTFSTKDTPKEVIASYVTKFESEGGVVEALGSTPTKEIFSGRTADELIYVVYAGEVNGETIVTININPAQ